MKGFQSISGVILITIGLLMLHPHLVSAAYTMSETCSYVTKSWISDPTSCQKWGFCEGGKLVGTGTCDDGLLFDTQTGTCNYADSVTCMTTVEDTCKNLPNPQMIADPNDCTQYCYCGPQNSTSCATCPKNQVYNPNTGSCVWSSSYNCPANSICRLVPDNTFASDPVNCGNYIDCIKGAGTSTPCNNNLYYNPENGYCQTANPCTNSGGTAGPPTPSAGPGVINPLPNDPTQCKTGVPTFLADGATCMGYYLCDQSDKAGTWSKCPQGTHFDQAAQKCVTPYSVTCQYDRCGNINQSFVTQSTLTDQTCTTYNYCINETTQKGSSGTCPSDYSFFNEVTGACNPTKPDYVICGGTK